VWVFSIFSRNLANSTQIKQLLISHSTNFYASTKKERNEFCWQPYPKASSLLYSI
jgi:hypothetical protein